MDFGRQPSFLFVFCYNKQYLQLTLFFLCESKAWRDLNSLEQHSIDKQHQEAAFPSLCVKVWCEETHRSKAWLRQSSVYRVTSPKLRCRSSLCMSVGFCNMKMNMEWNGVCEYLPCATSMQSVFLPWRAFETGLLQLEWRLLAGSFLGEAIAAMPWDVTFPCSLYVSCSCLLLVCSIAQESLLFTSWSCWWFQSKILLIE